MTTCAEATGSAATHARLAPDSGAGGGAGRGAAGTRGLAGGAGARAAAGAAGWQGATGGPLAAAVAIKDVAGGALGGVGVIDLGAAEAAVGAEEAEPPGIGAASRAVGLLER